MYFAALLIGLQLLVGAILVSPNSYQSIRRPQHVLGDSTDQSSGTTSTSDQTQTSSDQQSTTTDTTTQSGSSTTDTSNTTPSDTSTTTNTQTSQDQTSQTQTNTTTQDQSTLNQTASPPDTSQQAPADQSAPSDQTINSPDNTLQPTNSPSDNSSTTEGTITQAPENIFSNELNLTLTPSQISETPTPESSQQETPSPQVTEALLQENTSGISATPAIQIEASSPDTQNSATGSTDQNQQSTIQSAIDQSLTTLDNSVFPNLSTENPTQTLSNQTVNDVTTQNSQLTTTQTPDQQANLLTEFASTNIQSVDKNLQTGNFTDASFQTQRFTYQITSALSDLQKVNGNSATDLKNKIKAVCDSAEYALRPQQLTIPEDSEQTLDTARGICMNLQP